VVLEQLIKKVLYLWTLRYISSTNFIWTGGLLSETNNLSIISPSLLPKRLEFQMYTKVGPGSTVILKLTHNNLVSAFRTHLRKRRLPSHRFQLHSRSLKEPRR
jgi:hypothetical protein